MFRNTTCSIQFPKKCSTTSLNSRDRRRHMELLVSGSYLAPGEPLWVLSRARQTKSGRNRERRWPTAAQRQLKVQRNNSIWQMSAAMLALQLVAAILPAFGPPRNPTLLLGSQSCFQCCWIPVHPRYVLPFQGTMPWNWYFFKLNS